MLDKKKVRNKAIGKPVSKTFIYTHMGLQVEASDETEAREMAKKEAKARAKFIEDGKKIEVKKLTRIL